MEEFLPKSGLNVPYVTCMKAYMQVCTMYQHSSGEEQCFLDTLHVIVQGCPEIKTFLRILGDFVTQVGVIYVFFTVISVQALAPQK